MILDSSKPIGIFDSGIGGLTIVKNLMTILPEEDIIYFGDIARIPYGTKSRVTIEKFATQTVKFLVKQKVKAIIIACNTISAIAKDIIKKIAKDIVVIDIINAGASLINNLNSVGIIATLATINSNAYTLEIYKNNPNINIYTRSCGLFVSMIEEGFIKGQIVELVVKEYLSYFVDKKIDALILGCTHYPIIKDSILKVLNVKLIDPSAEASNSLKKLLIKKNLLNVSGNKAKHRFYVTDIPLRFKSIGEIFLQKQMKNIRIVNLDSYQ